jgi:hypothetical protein
LKEVFVIKIERELTEEESEYLKTLSENEVTAILEEHKQSLVEYFDDEGIDESDIKTLEIRIVE